MMQFLPKRRKQETGFVRFPAFCMFGEESALGGHFAGGVGQGEGVGGEVVGPDVAGGGVGGDGRGGDPVEGDAAVRGADREGLKAREAHIDRIGHMIRSGRGRDAHRALG